MSFTIEVNGNPHRVDVDGDTPLLWVLRDVLGMTGTKFGCGIAQCGACTVHIDGVATRSCITSIDSLSKSKVTGQIMSASALLASKPHPSNADIDDAMSGNICRCGTYVRIREAINLAAQTNEKRG